jgi:hypothetical protein
VNAKRARRDSGERARAAGEDTGFTIKALGEVPGAPLTRWRISLEMVHWTISLTFVEPREAPQFRPLSSE